jgi:DNA-binding NtrC family response regulator
MLFPQIPRDMSLKQFMEGIEKELLLGALCRTNGNQVAAASLLKIPRTTLAAKLKYHKIEKTYWQVA